MKVRCMTSTPTPQQAIRLGSRFNVEQQRFSVEPGLMYLVFGVETYNGTAWVMIEHEAGYLVSAPILLFEIVDDRIPCDWRLKVEEGGDLRLLPSELLDPFFLDDLSEGVPHVLEAFRAMRLRYCTQVD